MKRPALTTKIIGKTVFIKLPLIKDAKKIFDYTQNKELTKHVTWQAPQSLKESILFVKKRLLMAKNGEKFLCGIYLNKTKEFVGSAGYIKFDDENRSIELGYWVAKPFQRQGVARECLSLLTNYAFKKLGSEKIIITCSKDNTASRELAKSMGFIYNKSLKKHIKIRNKLVERFYYCLEKSNK